MTNSINAALHDNSKIPLGLPKLVPNKASHSRVPQSPSLNQIMFINKNLTIKSSNNKPYPLPAPFQIDEYRTMKAKKINEALNEAIPLKHPMLLHEAMRYTFRAGGKRLFPTLCIAACEAVGGNQSTVMPLACAMEIIITTTEILDDLPCLDNDDFRRGKPANHKVFGEAISVLACQALLSLAIDLIATKTKNVSPDRLLRVIADICSCAGSEGGPAAQVLEINSKGKEVSLSEVELIHRNKCGKILETSVVGGALFGGANEEEIERLYKYGKCVGLAHQVWDDTLDVEQDSRVDKPTFVKLMGMDGAKKYARDLVAEANLELAYFDSKRAAPLHHMANFVVSRRN